eukprot:Skav224540  [mRNA]  locus=scaffold2543:31376:31609:+ [translate_table: standard]
MRGAAHHPSAIRALASGPPMPKKAAGQVGIHVGIQLISHVTFLALGLLLFRLRQNISNAGQHDGDACVAHWATEGGT